MRHGRPQGKGRQNNKAAGSEGFPKHGGLFTRRQIGRKVLSRLIHF